MDELAKLGLPTQFGGGKGRRDPVRMKRRKILYDDEGEISSENIVEVEHLSDESEFLNEPTDEITGATKEIAANIDDSTSEYLNQRIAKFYAQRYRLFSRYDQGIRMDEEAWFSVTPEKIACHIAERCRCDVMIDAFCGVGGNAIQFATGCRLVIAIDIDPVKLQYAKHNAEIYRVADKIEFVQGDALQLLPHFKAFADGIFLSPPWGGPEYLNQEEYDLRQMGPFNGLDVLDLALSVCDNVAFFIPRNSDPQQLVAHVGTGRFELEKNFLNEKWKTNTAYFGKFKK